MRKPMLSVSELAIFFGVSEKRIKEQYAANAKTISEMRNKALATGKKVRGYSAAELVEAAAEFQILAQ